MLDDEQVDGILIAKLDRLSRSVIDWNELIDRYFSEKAGRFLWSVGDSIDTRTAAGRLVLNVLMSVAQWEREKIAESTKEALQNKIKSNSKCGSKVRYGLRIDQSDPRRSKKQKLPVGLVVAQDEARAVELMKRLRDEGMSLRKIARELDRAAIPPRDGGLQWDHTSVRKILKRA